MSKINCSVCNKPIKPPKRSYCSRKCSCKAYQKRRPNNHTMDYYSKSPRNFFQGLLQKKNKERQDLTLDFLESLWEEQGGRCAVSGVPMTHIRGQGQVNTNISIDRVNSELGYTEDNVQLVCRIVNIMKLNMTPIELNFWCEAILNNNTSNNSATNLKMSPQKANRSYPRTKKAGRKKKS